MDIILLTPPSIDCRTIFESSILKTAWPLDTIALFSFIVGSFIFISPFSFFNLIYPVSFSTESLIVTFLFKFLFIRILSFSSNSSMGRLLGSFSFTWFRTWLISIFEVLLSAKVSPIIPKKKRKKESRNFYTFHRENKKRIWKDFYIFSFKNTRVFYF